LGQSTPTTKPPTPMSLNWKMPDSFNKKLIWRTLKGEPLNLDDKEQEVNVQPELECLIFGTMTIQHDLNGEMNDDALKEISRRIELLNGVNALPTYSIWDKGNQQQKIKISLETIIRYWGLWTNVTHLSRAKWDKFLLRITKPNDYEFTFEKEQALKTIKEYPDLTEGERILGEWDAKAKLTTPPPALDKV